MGPLAFLHGAASGLLLLVGCLLWRDRRAILAGRLGTALALGAAAHAVAETPGLWAGGPWQAGLSAVAAGTSVLFWLWARASFDEEFTPRSWHAAVWVAMVGAALLAGAGWQAARMLLPLASLGFAILAVVQTLATWRADLVAGRRRLRVVVLVGSLIYIAALSVPDLPFMPARSGTPRGELPGIVPMLGLCALAALWCWRLLRVAGTGATLPASADVLGAVPVAAPRAQDTALIRRLERLMAEERAYRQEGLTIGRLAARLEVPEYRLRQAINEGLGHRNFNAFLNHYRIGEAKAALADPAQKEVPVLTIAMDAGFQSLGPFNRAFKAATGMTPTEFRRAAEIGKAG